MTSEQVIEKSAIFSQVIHMPEGTYRREAKITS
jgi:hypothetical protein